MKMFLLALIFLLGGCMSAVSNSPVGDPMSSSLQASHWNSSWVSYGGSSFKTRIVDADAGLIEAYDISLMGESGKKIALPSPTVQIILRQLDDTVIVANARDPRLPDSHHFIFGRVANSYGSLLLFKNNGSAFDLMGRSGSIKSQDVTKDKKFDVPQELRFLPHETPFVLIDGYSSANPVIRKANANCPAAYFKNLPDAPCQPPRELFSDLPEIVFIRSDKLLNKQP